MIESFYPKVKGAGWPLIGVERMLRIRFLRHGLKLSDTAVEEALFDARAMCAALRALTWVRSYISLFACGLYCANIEQRIRLTGCSELRDHS